MLKDRGNVAIIAVTVLVVGTLMGAALVAGRAGDLLRTGGRGPLVGNPAPDFSLSTPEGELVTLTGFRGHPVMLNFWATWCSPCVAELPLIQERYLANRPELVVLAVNACETPGLVSDFAADMDLELPILLDEDCSVGDRDYRVTGYPTSVFIDADGVVRSVYIGSMTASTLDKNLRLIGIAP